MPTFRQRYNQKYKFKRDDSHSLDDIAKTTGIKKSILQDVFRRGVGARKTNPESVRSATTGKKEGGKSLRGKMTAEQWGQSRVYGFVMKNPKQVGEGKPDNDLFKKIK